MTTSRDPAHARTSRQPAPSGRSAPAGPTDADAPTPGAPAPSRDVFWDAVRGVCILGVVWTHTRTGIPYLDGPHAWNFDAWLVVREVWNFPVAVFVFLAAFFVRPARVLERPGAWLRSRAVRLGVPFLVWSTAFTLLGAALAGTRDVRRLVRDVVLGASAPHLYFVLVLLQLVVVTPLLLRVLEARWRWVMWLVTPAFAVWLYVRTLADGGPPSFSNTWLLGWFGFYWAGLWVRRYGTPRVGVRAAVVIAVLATAASVAEAALLVRAGVDVGFAVGQLSGTSVVAAFAVVLLLVVWHERRTDRGDTPPPGRFARALAHLGRDSYGIYYVHVLWLTLLWRAVAPPWSGDGLVAMPVLPLLQLAEAAGALALSLGLMAAVRALVGRTAASRWLGF
ncbi:acyltransferase family protein [Litorihabitans aurantiacus]|uniref:Acyltransferase 3 domain-containing protein n=1 Tax=Litorihabitans aurantiacus TaxID=1930061 RepID=A0AA38CWI5_9MICO|nr:acyltransferase [Litorihabitans aurantiacus]GMA33445.1 hypothetical protein GCM10025875_34370 [Litorihabitans aurantiacus]